MVDLRIAGVLLWLAIGLIALLRPQAFAKLGGRDASHINTHPIPGYISYGLHVRLVGAFMVAIGLFLAAGLWIYGS